MEGKKTTREKPISERGRVKKGERSGGQREKTRVLPESQD